VELFAFDKNYVDRLRLGDPTTENHFVTYFNQFLRIKLRARMLSSDLVEDLRQETFVRVISELRREESVHQPERFGAFVNSICNNVLTEFHRASSRTVPLEDTYLETHDHAQDPDRLTDAKQSKDRIRQIIEELSEKDRDLLRAYFLEEKDKDEVCQEFGVDRDYLRVLLHRSKDKFETVYRAEGAAPAEDKAHCIATPPGSALYSLAEFICNKKTMEEIVIPLLGDMQFEHNEALSVGRKWKAMLVRVRGCWSFFSAIGINHLVRGFLKIFLRPSSR
jgi:RNA polymerase sigma-70 factor (ECF subfamily)